MVNQTIEFAAGSGYQTPPGMDYRNPFKSQFTVMPIFMIAWYQYTYFIFGVPGLKLWSRAVFSTLGRDSRVVETKNKASITKKLQKNTKIQWFEQSAGGRRVIETKKSFYNQKIATKNIKNTVLQAVGRGPQSYRNKKTSFYNQKIATKNIKNTVIQAEGRKVI